MLKAYTTVSILVALDFVAPGCSPSSGRTAQTNATDSGGGSSFNGGGGTTSSTTPNQDGGFIVSTSGGSGGAGGDTDCGRNYFPVEQKPADMLLVLDRSASMEDGTPSKWSIVIPALHGVVDATAASLWWGLKVFPVGTDAQCTPGTFPSGVVVNVGANNASAMDSAIDATTDTGNGTPTGDAVSEAAKYLQTLQDGNPKYLVLATDGEPSCNGMTGSTDSSGARTAAISAITAAANVGFHTFVVGIATTKDTASATLNSMAVEGREARLDPNPLATRYYMASTQSDLVSAFNSITSVVKTCLFPVPKPPPDPGHVNVSVDTTKIAFDPARANGWNFTGGDMLTIQLYGAACDLVTSSGAAAVQVVFGCKNDTLIIT